MLPSLDLCNATAAGSVSIQNEHDETVGNATQRNVMTANEISGICERLGSSGNYSGQPSQR